MSETCADFLSHVADLKVKPHSGASGANPNSETFAANASSYNFAANPQSVVPFEPSAYPGWYNVQ